MTWTTGDVSNSTTLTDSDHLYPVFFNELRTSVDFLHGSFATAIVARDSEAEYYCDGTADDVQIQAALTAVGITGGIVYVKEGTYDITAQLLIPSNVWLRGSGWATILRLTNSFAVNTYMITNSTAVTGNSNIIVSDFQVDGNKANNTGNLKYGILFENVSNPVFDKIYIHDCVMSGLNTGGTGLPTYYNGQRVLMSNCIGENMGTNGSAFYIDEARDVSMVNCHSYGTGTGRSGITIQSSVNINLDNVTVRDEEGNGTPIYITGALSGDRPIQNINLSNISIYTTGVAVSKYGLWLEGRAAGSIYATGIKLSNVKIYGGYFGINASFIKDFQFTNVSVDNAYGHGMYIANSLNGYIQAIVKNSNQAGSDNNGITLANVTGVRTEGSHCYDDQVVKTQQYGILEASGSDYNTIIGNDLRGNAVGAATIIGANDKVGFNLGYVTANSGTGSIASGATTAVITHGLSVTPTVDDISITFAEQGSSDYGRWWVSTITSTQFTLNVSVNPGASNLDFGWRAMVL